MPIHILIRKLTHLLPWTIAMPPVPATKPIPLALFAACATGAAVSLLRAWTRGAGAWNDVFGSNRSDLFLGSALVASLAVSRLIGHRSPKSLVAAALVGAFGYLATQYLLGSDIP